MSAPASGLVCAGCGAALAWDDPYPFRCPNSELRDGVDHVLRREIDAGSVDFPAGLAEGSPFVRYRTLLYSYATGRAGGLDDAELVDLVHRLDEDVAAIDGRGFRITPFARSDALSGRLGFSAAGGVWVKDETGNVSGSHKARHLFEVLLQIEVAERLGLTRGARPDLAIASCGNAALAAAVVAAAAGRRLLVFVPEDADPVVLARLRELGADVTACPRAPGVPGDPTVRALHAALADGALPFTCQGDLNALAVEGGKTLAWELVESGVELDRLVVQVGGGALASACSEGLADAVALGALRARPRIDTVQTEGAWPLKRAYDAVLALGGTSALTYAAHHRSEFMRPWEHEPRSVAHGILDDETYDWLAVVEGMLATRGTALVVGERTLLHANELAHTTGIPVDATGSAGLAGLLALRESGAVGDDERVAVLFTGVDRSRSTDREETSHEELSRTGHPVAQGVRAR